MKITSLSLLVALLPMAALSLDIVPAKTDLACEFNTALAQSSKANVGHPVREADQRQLLLAFADDADDEQNGKAKGKGKSQGKGKAKGHDKDKNQESNAVQNPETTGSAPATAEPAQGKPTGQPAAVVPESKDTSSTAQRAQATSPRRSSAEIKTEMDQRLARITALDKNTATSNARFATISKETGVPVATLQAQRKAHNVGSGGILIANEMAKATGKPATTFLKQRLQGRNWDQIAAENKFDLAPVLPKLERLQNGMEAVPQPAKH